MCHPVMSNVVAQNGASFHKPPAVYPKIYIFLCNSRKFAKFVDATLWKMSDVRWLYYAPLFTVCFVLLPLLFIIGTQSSLYNNVFLIFRLHYGGVYTTDNRIGLTLDRRPTVES